MDDLYKEAVEFGRKKGGEEGIDACLNKYKLDVMVVPWTSMAFLSMAQLVTQTSRPVIYGLCCGWLPNVNK